MRSIEELSDRLEIQDLQVAYSHAVDFRRWEKLDEVFTEDAFIDYTAFGGPSGTYSEIKRYLAETMSMFSSTTTWSPPARWCSTATPPPASPPATTRWSDL